MPARAAIYLDSNAGAPLKRHVVEALRPFLTESGALLANPSSSHSHGRQARKLLAGARENIARSLGISINPDHLFFTSSGTEANQLAIRAGFSWRAAQGRSHWITTQVEHPSVIKMAQWVESQSGRVSVLAVDTNGIVDVAQLSGQWSAQSGLVSCVWVNSETGVISPIREIAAEVSRLGGFLHLDAAQAWGKLPIRLEETGADLVSFSGHKIGALSGTGVLWASERLAVAAREVAQASRGSENFLGAFSVGAAAADLDPLSWAEQMARLVGRLEKEVSSAIRGVRINGIGAPRVANTTHLSFDGIEKEGLVAALDLEGFSVSAGPACQSGVTEPSTTLLAMGLSPADAKSGIRVSLDPSLKWPDLELFVGALTKTVGRMRAKG